MTFKLNPKFSTASKAEALKPSTFNSKLVLDLKAEQTQEYKFDPNKIQASLDANVEEVLGIEHSSISSGGMPESVEDSARARDSKLISSIQRGADGADQGWDDLICPVVGVATNMAVTAATASTGVGAIGAKWVGRGAGVAASVACKNIKDWLEEEEDFFDDGHEFEDDPGAEEDCDCVTPEPNDVDPDDEDPGKTPDGEPTDPEEPLDPGSDGSEEDPNKDPDDESGNETEGEHDNTQPIGDSTEGSANPMDDGHNGSGGEADSSLNDVNGDINWGPDGGSSEGSSGLGRIIDRLDPITNWGPDGKPGNASGAMKPIGIGNGDPNTNWGDEYHDQSNVQSDLLERLGEINPTHNEANGDNADFTKSLVLSQDFFL